MQQSNISSFIFSVLDIAQNSNVQDAFVIAVEQQARDRLEKLSALRKIKPVDMTKLSQELNDLTSPDNVETLNGIIENSAIYVTSVPGLSKNLTQQTNGYKDDTDDGRNEHSNDHIVVARLHNTEEEIELKQDIVDSGTSEKFNGTQDIELFEAINNNAHYALGRKDSNNSSVNMEAKPHREMAVDVPESFVATAKQSPRYPPPRQNGSAHRIRPQSDYSSDRSLSRSSKDHKGSHTPSSSMDSAASSNFKKPSLLPKPKFDDGGKSAPTYIQDNVHNIKVNGGPIVEADNAQDPGQLDRIRKYQVIIFAFMCLHI